MILLRTIHGSRLYNLSHENSDSDWYEVYSGKGRAKQTIVGGTDTLRISFDSFLYQCCKGVPQALEALYSPAKEVNCLEYLTDSFNGNNTEVYKTYVRTIKNFWNKDSVKTKQHAIRLCINLCDILNSGRFNPSLSPEKVSLVKELGSLDSDECPGFDLLGFPLYIW